MALRVILIVCVLSGIAAAEPTTQPCTDFPRGTWTLTLEGAYAHSFTWSEARIETASAGVGYYFLDNVSLNAEVAGFWDQQPGADSRIAEANLLIRHHLFNLNRLSIFMDIGGGVSYADVRTPVGGTYFNFSLQTGPGVTWRLTDNLFLIGGARYLHFSNAAIKGPENNPSINALEGYAGVLFTF